MITPNFFIIGSPKCGTTSLASWLSQHPEIFMSEVKEPHFMSTDLGHGRIKNFQEYESLFQDAVEGKHLAIGEASTEYLYSLDAVPNIERKYPRAKYIVMLRNPVDMVVSFHAYERAEGRENIGKFNEAWEASEHRRAGKKVTRTCPDPKWYDYKDIASFGTQLERLYRIVEKERVLVVLLDDIKSQPTNEYTRVLKFLDVAPGFEPDYSVENQRPMIKFFLFSRFLAKIGPISRKIKPLFGIPANKSLGILSIVGKLNSSKADALRVDSYTLKLVQDHYLEEIGKVERILGRNLDKWRKSDID